MNYIAVKFAFKTIVGYFLLFDNSLLPETLVGFWLLPEMLVGFWLLPEMLVGFWLLPETLVGFWLLPEMLVGFWSFSTYDYILVYRRLRIHLLVSFGFCHVYILVVFIFFLCDFTIMGKPVLLLT
jgi:hypothetical protein